MITREQVADLQPGDVVEISGPADVGTVVRGELRSYPSATVPGDGLHLGPGLPVRRMDGGVAQQWLDANWTLTIVSRAPRRLYVNHSRTEPSCGDVFQPEYSQWPLWVAGHGRIAEHKSAESCRWIGRESLPDRLRLLVDGETGQVVP